MSSVSCSQNNFITKRYNSDTGLGADKEHSERQVLVIGFIQKSTIMQLLALVLLAESVMCFAPTTQSRPSFKLHATRRQILETALLSAPIVLIGSSAALADVSDGNELPEGVAQFARLVKIKADIVGVKQRLTSDPEGIDKKEWSNIGAFLRRIYAEADDIKSIANSQSPEKKKQAQEIADQLQKYSKGGESSVNEQDAKALIAILDKCSSLFQDFFDTLSDVPDEI